MALDIFEQHGIKEVADVQVEALEDDARLGVKKGDIVLYLDTLKVSTVEMTAEQTEARGGKGNPPLIIWDFGREITITLQDALFSATSLALITGGAKKEAAAASAVAVRYTEQVVATAEGAFKPTKATGTEHIMWINKTQGTRGQIDAAAGTVTAAEDVAAGDVLQLFYDVQVSDTGGTAYEITIDASHFPGTYKIIGDTVARNRNGKDTSLQFVVPRAKFGSEVTFTMEAEGDPAVFDMNMRVLRPDDGQMIKFVKYSLE